MVELESRQGLVQSSAEHRLQWFSDLSIVEIERRRYVIYSVIIQM